MKLHLIIIYIILSCSSFVSIKAQENILPKPMHGIQLYPDSIRVEFQDQNAVILFQFKTISKGLQKLDKFPEQLKMIEKMVRESLPNLNTAKKVNIVETNLGEYNIEIKDNFNSTRLRVKDNSVEELLPPGWDVHFETTYAMIHLYIHQWEDVASLAEEDFSQISESIRSKMDKEFVGRKRTISRSIYNNKALSFNETKFQMPIDMLAINASFGFGFYRNFYAPEINFSAMVIRNDRFNRPYTQFGLIYENKFFTTKTESGGFTAQTNSFLSLGYAINAYKLDDPFWIGFGAGLLVRNSGDYFQGKTAKFFLTTGSKKIKLIPEFYLTNDFKTFSLGAKVSYTL
jgi:hypothetical protein